MAETGSLLLSIPAISFSIAPGCSAELAFLNTSFTGNGFYESSLNVVSITLSMGATVHTLGSLSLSGIVPDLSIGPPETGILEIDFLEVDLLCFGGAKPKPDQFVIEPFLFMTASMEVRGNMALNFLDVDFTQDGISNAGSLLGTYKITFSSTGIVGDTSVSGSLALACILGAMEGMTIGVESNDIFSGLEGSISKGFSDYNPRFVRNV